MAVNKVVLNDETLIDLTGDTVTAADVVIGKKFHLPSGEQAIGIMKGSTTSENKIYFFEKQQISIQNDRPTVEEFINVARNTGTYEVGPSNFVTGYMLEIPLSDGMLILRTLSIYESSRPIGCVVIEESGYQTGTFSMKEYVDFSALRQRLNSKKIDEMIVKNLELANWITDILGVTYTTKTVS